MVAEFKMNQEKLKQLQAQVRIGGKGTARRKKKVVHRTATTDDKKLQSSLKKLSGACNVFLINISSLSSPKNQFCYLCSSDRCVEVDTLVSGCGGGVSRTSDLNQIHCELMKINSTIIVNELFLDH